MAAEHLPVQLVCRVLVEIWHNRRRRHSQLGMLSPIEFERTQSITVARESKISTPRNPGQAKVSGFTGAVHGRGHRFDRSIADHFGVRPGRATVGVRSGDYARQVTIDYSIPGALTRLDGVPSAALDTVATEPVSVCAPVHALVIQPTDPEAADLPERRRTENQIRPAAELVSSLLALDPAPLNSARDPGNRVVGTCRHFAVISCALLRYRRIAARVRCGFATYFQAGRGVDHWITEYHDPAAQRWVRIDSEILGQGVIERPDDLAPGHFLTGGEAWLAFRRGDIDASRFGVHGTENWGPGEIRGNAVKDLAAINKVEMLPWDEWGRMTDAYDGRTGPDYDDLLDTLAAVCGADDPAAVAALYDHPALRVPSELIG